MSDETRAEALYRFNKLTGLGEKPGHELVGVVYAGHEREDTRYTFHFADGRELRLTDRKLWSAVEFEREYLVKMRAWLEVGDHKKWHLAIKALLVHVAEEIVLEGEAFVDAVRDWIGDYTRHATDVAGAEARAEAAAASAPYLEGAKLHVHADHLLRYIRREKEEKIQRRDLFQALRDLGFERATINYTTRNGSGPASRHSTSYYRGALRASQADSRPDETASSSSESDLL